MDTKYAIVIDEDTFIDESGLTSLEPEGVGHPHWAPPYEVEREEDREEGSFSDDPVLRRGMIPVEGDGDNGLSD